MRNLEKSYWAATNDKSSIYGGFSQKTLIIHETIKKEDLNFPIVCNNIWAPKNRKTLGNAFWFMPGFF
ncbi:MAG: hypothetical protein DRR08_21925 [Candidatus Parabeggiatoa sp. nov. 2]|nr:MAG: hypothetical protein B6247_04495 [Beggiatoa sp. 4572_84]RKZ56360.1 MAG: hypothetical protein DRR08_21925 [Gammaproteobacteria bacterium]